ncbi:DYH10 protein, partial [Upupa epops]|nr:DYH10 protein [Upupa epops]
IKLEMPAINLDGEVSVLATVQEVIETLQSCAITWQNLISTALKEQMEKVPQGNGPLAHIDFWRERNRTLSALTEQTKLPEVQKVLEILQEARSEHVVDLQVVLSDLRKQHRETLHNTRFLSALEAHLKKLTYGTGLDVVLDTIPSLMNALRIVWIISQPYIKDKLMVTLVEEITWEISTRMYKAVDLHTLFKEDRTTAKSKITEAKRTLEQWKKCFLDVCAQLEESERGKYWQFDRKRLFEKTDWMALVCQDLYDILQVIEEFHNVFGPEMKLITGNLKCVDDLLRGVNGLTRPIEELTFDPFSIKSAQDWKLIMDMFREGVSVENIKQIFVKNLKNPPLFKGHPPVAGAIAWSQFLFRQIKHPIIRFQEVEGLLASARGKEVKQIYLQVAKRLKEYGDQKYNQWRKETKQLLPVLVQNTLLKVVTEEPVTVNKSVHFIVNFSPELRELITEAKYMEKLGFPVPEMARYVALQEDKYLRYLNRLKNILNCYHKLMGTLNEAETKLLDDHIQGLWRIFQPGHKRLTWDSLGVGDFIMRCTPAVRSFEWLVQQVHSYSEGINDRLLFIESANLFKFPLSKNGDELPKAKEFFDYIICKRAKDVEHMVRKYSEIPQLLIKVERHVANTNSGKSPKLASYYAYWEKKIYQVLTQLIVRNLQAFNAAVLANVPLFQIEAVLSVPEIILQPNASEIVKMTVQCIEDCVEVTKRFVRWMHGMCIECPPQRVEDGVFTFTFYSDVSQDPLIIELACLITENVHKLLTSLTKCFNQWQRYRQLWELDKDVVLEKFAAEKPTCVAFDDEFQFYMKVAQEVTHQPLIKDEQFIRLQLAPLASMVQENARGWSFLLGKLLNKSAREELFSLQEEIHVG